MPVLSVDDVYSMKKKPQGEEAPIQTERLPIRCPACGQLEPTVTLKRVNLLRVTCRRPCGWSSHYEIVPRAFLLEKGEFH